ncbi:hypothetical protein DSM106972_056470 [Dulcicalothrix desertica PCC 7102]|uniref:Uncharacterized protein n=1 Tax=Dulcicalothrix desertica PCC 7102 TaxID=232991 RepID=A0A3S1CHC7_9CYAN|nr:hypothetical protein [Dulcicalothrix desertica]RUT02727.1 hypothetical protein DSM106972_056470 [Dulcicalothrix desertica PCC 7102]TWH39038.1 hypothetical protein CAL7102_08242 [Dulcicalothrix desertica PCC 7102]
MVTAASEVGFVGGAVTSSQMFLEHVKNNPSINRRISAMIQTLKKHLNTIILVGVLGNFSIFSYGMTQQISANVSSQTAISSRQRALVNIAKHVKSDTCWQNKANYPLKINDVIAVEGTETGKIPTSCVYVPKTKQFLNVVYSNGEVTVTRIFSIKEVQNQLSMKGDN